MLLKFCTFKSGNFVKFGSVSYNCMSDNQEIKKNILLELSKELAEFKFKLKGSNFTRETEAGLYQIIDISLGPSTSTKANHIGLGFGMTTEEWIENLNNWK